MFLLRSIFCIDIIFELRSAQWLDVYFEDLRKVGTYPILSVTVAALANNTMRASQSHVEVVAHCKTTLQTQRLSDQHPSAADIPLMVRFGGAFLWPPISLAILDNMVFVADGLQARLVSAINAVLEKPCS